MKINKKINNLKIIKRQRRNFFAARLFFLVILNINSLVSIFFLFLNVINTFNHLDFATCLSSGQPGVNVNINVQAPVRYELPQMEGFEGPPLFIDEFGQEFVDIFNELRVGLGVERTLEIMSFQLREILIENGFTPALGFLPRDVAPLLINMRIPANINVNDPLLIGPPTIGVEEEIIRINVPEPVRQPPETVVINMSEETYNRMASMRDTIEQNNMLREEAEAYHYHSLYDEPNTSLDHLHPDWRIPNVLTDPELPDFEYLNPEDKMPDGPVWPTFVIIAIIIFFSVDIISGLYRKWSKSSEEIAEEIKKEEENSDDAENASGSESEGSFFDL